MSNKEPWEEEGSPWKTKAAFFTWLRGRFKKSSLGNLSFKNIF